MKQALAYMVLNHDFEPVGKARGGRALLSTMVPPVDAQFKIRRKVLVEKGGNLHIRFQSKLQIPSFSLGLIYNIV